jgi:catechol 2,3-dioxygenase
VIKTSGLYHIHLHVRDLQRSLKFYQGVFGMEVLYRAGPSMAFLRTPGGQDLVTLNQAEASDRSVGESGGIAHFGFALDDSESLDKAVAEVEKHGGKLMKRGEHSPGHAYAYFTDPDGCWFEL